MTERRKSPSEAIERVERLADGFGATIYFRDGREKRYDEEGWAQLLASIRTPMLTGVATDRGEEIWSIVSRAMTEEEISTLDSVIVAAEILTNPGPIL